MLEQGDALGFVQSPQLAARSIKVVLAAVASQPLQGSRYGKMGLTAVVSYRLELPPERRSS